MKAIKAITENDPGSDPTSAVSSNAPLATQDQKIRITTPGKTDPCASLDRLVGVASNQELSLEEIKRERLEKQ